ncbi:YetF domain-containing protein [Geodermatophilus sp. SYSU D00700]
MGRTAVAEGQSFLVGAVALGTLLAAHAAVTLARGNRWIAKAVDHRVRVLVDHGRLRRSQLRACGLTENDVLAKLRELGIHEVGELRYVLYETKGELTVVRETGEPDGALVRAGLADAAGFDPGPRPSEAAGPRS